MTYLGMAAALLTLISLNAYALFCPNNFKSISVGDSLEFVMQECGPPTSEKRYKSTQGGAQEWEYYFKASFVDLRNVKVKFLFKDDKVVNISVLEPNAASPELCQAGLQAFNDKEAVQAMCAKQTMGGEQNLTSANLCGQVIRAGDESQKVEAACGKPALVKQYSLPQENAPEITEWRYEGSSGATLVFANGVLQDRQFN